MAMTGYEIGSNLAERNIVVKVPESVATKEDNINQSEAMMFLIVILIITLIIALFVGMTKMCITVNKRGRRAMMELNEIPNA